MSSMAVCKKNILPRTGGADSCCGWLQDLIRKVMSSCPNVHCLYILLLMILDCKYFSTFVKAPKTEDAKRTWSYFLNPHIFFPYCYCQSYVVNISQQLKRWALSLQGCKIYLNNKFHRNRPEIYPEKNSFYQAYFIVHIFLFEHIL